MKAALELGCGLQPQTKEGYKMFYSDYMTRKVPNFTLHNINYYPYPFESNKYDLVLCHNCFEHLVLHDKDGELWMMFFSEMARILKVGGKLDMIFPHFTSTDTMEHHTHFSVGEFAKFKDGNWNTQAGEHPLQVESIKVLFPSLWRGLGMFINNNNKLMEIWEKYLCFVIRGTDIHLIMERVK